MIGHSSLKKKVIGFVGKRVKSGSNHTGNNFGVVREIEFSSNY